MDEHSSASGTPAPDIGVPLDDPILDAHVERALSPYRALLSPEALAALEETLRMILATHPVVAPMVDSLRRGAGVERSGSRPKAGRADAPRGRAARGGSRRGGGE
jgi:hypothetical protein